MVLLLRAETGRRSALRSTPAISGGRGKRGANGVSATAQTAPLGETRAADRDAGGGSAG